jgi:phenylalanyl-tRNA synthetase beta chain
MKLSFKAFQRWLDFQGTAEELTKVLAGLGFPNDGVAKVGGGLSQVQVGKILSRNKHPQADRLSLLTVDVGSEKLPVVCGAQNMKEGDFVALAPVGATIPGKDGQGMTMKEAKIRGETSRGMCCSLAELQLAGDAEGIWILSPGVVNEKSLGRPVSDFFDLEDSILEIDVTPNRPDALSIRGLAREVAAKLGLKLKVPSLTKFKTSSSYVNLSVESAKDCLGFLAVHIQNVQQGQTPGDVCSILERMGSRVISPLVDITNFVMFELGHPMHFFDADKVDLKNLCVRRAKAGEKLTLLNDQTIELHVEDLVIADSTGPLSLAGVMGGAKTSVSDSTKNVLMEVACFDPQLIRATARRHQLSSESSYRFERGLTPHRLDEVAERALALMKEWGAFESAVGTKVSEKVVPLSVLWDRKRIESKIGKVKLSDDELFEMLRRLEYSFEARGKTTVSFPWYRVDGQCLEDIMEDVARLIGYDDLEERPLTFAESISTIRDLQPRYTLGEKLTERWTNLGFSEVVHMSFSDPAVEGRLGIPLPQPMTIQNPIHAEKSTLRQTLIHQLLERARLNLFHGEEDVRLVEVGPVFRSDLASMYEESPVVETLAVACLWVPRPDDKKRLWSRSADAFFEFKGMVERVYGDVRFKMKPVSYEGLFHPKRRIGHQAGELHPLVQKAFDLPSRALLGEWILEVEVRNPQYHAPSAYPAIDLDASFLVDDKISVADMIKTFEKAKAPFLEWIRCYDLFEGGQLPANKKSLTFAMRYKSPEKTLTLEEAKLSHDKLVSSVIEVFGSGSVALR